MDYNLLARSLVVVHPVSKEVRTTFDKLILDSAFDIHVVASQSNTAKSLCGLSWYLI